MLSISTLSKYNFTPDINLIVRDLEKVVQVIPPGLNNSILEDINYIKNSHLKKIPINIVSELDNNEFIDWFFKSDEFELNILKDPFQPIGAFQLNPPINFYLVEMNSINEKSRLIADFLSEKSLITFIVTDGEKAWSQTNDKSIAQLKLSQLQEFESLKDFFQSKDLYSKLENIRCAAQINPVTNYVDSIEYHVNEQLTKLNLDAKSILFKFNELREKKDQLKVEERGLLESLKKGFDTHTIDVEKNLKGVIKYAVSQNNPKSMEFKFNVKVLDNKKVITPTSDIIDQYNEMLSKATSQINTFFRLKNEDFVTDLNKGLLENYQFKLMNVFEIDKLINESIVDTEEYFEELSKKGVFEYFYKIYRPIFMVLMVASLGPRLLGETITSFNFSMPSWGMPVIIIVFLGSAWFSLRKAKEQERYERDNKIKMLQKKLIGSYEIAVESFSKRQLEEYKYYKNEYKENMDSLAKSDFELKEKKELVNKKRELNILENRKKVNEKKSKELSKVLDYISKIKGNIKLFNEFLVSDFKINNQ